MTKSLLFKVNYGWELRMNFEIRKKRNNTKVKEFVKDIKKTYEKAKAVLRKSQEKMKKYIDRNRKKVIEYKVRDGVLLSTKNLMWQMRNRETKKLIEKL